MLKIQMNVVFYTVELLRTVIEGETDDQVVQQVGRIGFPCVQPLGFLRTLFLLVSFSSLLALACAYFHLRRRR